MYISCFLLITSHGSFICYLRHLKTTSQSNYNLILRWETPDNCLLGGVDSPLTSRLPYQSSKWNLMVCIVLTSRKGGCAYAHLTRVEANMTHRSQPSCKTCKTNLHLASVLESSRQLNVLKKVLRWILAWYIGFMNNCLLIAILAIGSSGRETTLWTE